jgi:hypothetical protein
LIFVNWYWWLYNENVIKEDMKGSCLFLQLIHNWFTHEMKSAVLTICSHMMFLQLVHTWNEICCSYNLFTHDVLTIGSHMKWRLLFLQLFNIWKRSQMFLLFRSYMKPSQMFLQLVHLWNKIIYSYNCFTNKAKSDVLTNDSQIFIIVEIMW